MESSVCVVVSLAIIISKGPSAGFFAGCWIIHLSDIGKVNLNTYNPKNLKHCLICLLIYYVIC